jgi:hypothetical protein
MNTKATLKNFADFKYPTPKIEESLLVKIAMKVRSERGFNSAIEPTRYSIDNVYKKLLAIYEGHVSFDALTRKEYSVVPWAMFLIYDNKPRLIEFTELLGDYFNFINGKYGDRSIAVWLHVYLLYFPLQSKYWEVLRSKINETLELSSSHKVTQLKSWVDNCSILSIDAAQYFSKTCLKEGVKETFAKYRLFNSLTTGQFACIGLKTLLTLFGSSFSYKDEKEQISQIQSLFAQVVTKNELNYPTLRADLADGLLQSFSGQQAPVSTKKLLKDFFLKFYGDIRTEKIKWIGVSDEAKQVMQQWMVENTLNDFFALLSYVARTDFTADRHWQYRKRFWNAYLKRGVISEAWFALGPVAYHGAKQFLEGEDNVYASLNGAQNKHSALIMVIDGVLITEWSHSGSYRLWDSHRQRPLLYQKKYHKDELTQGSDYFGGHYSSDTGSWQKTLSTKIDDLTGIKITRREYMYD